MRAQRVRRPSATLGLTAAALRRCSPWVADMVADGHTGRIANVDISPVVTEHMREKHASLPPNVSWEVADATKLTAHGNASFDAVIDKGTLDALMVRSG
jgi:ubiquinone/menaquinone biosynthesis C-methylase UbiE